MQAPRFDATFLRIVATIGTNAIRATARAAVEDIASQMLQRTVACYWDSRSVWGLQAADYLLWATQREIMGRTSGRHSGVVQTLTSSKRFPWGI
ncbi:DUF3800 domain-containing protein [Trueperella pyogenes]